MSPRPERILSQNWTISSWKRDIGQVLSSIVKFARVRIIATCLALVFLGSAAADDLTWKTLLAFVLIVAFTIHANSINDYADRDIDAINLKDATDRPLVSKDITSAQFWGIHFGSALALGLAAFYGWRAVFLTLAILFIDYIYSLKPLRVTDRTFAAPLLLAGAYTYYSFSLGFWSVESAQPYPWLLTAGLALGFVARLLLKDFRDVRGDKRHGKITFLLRFGPRITTAVSGLFWIVAMAAVVAATSFASGVLVPLALGSVMVCAWLYELAGVRNVDDQQKLVVVIARAANVAIITLLAYLLCWQRTDLSALELQAIPLATGVALLGFNWLQNRKELHVKTN
ncbi:MAG TPA: UbiA family prenyltransferase [Verrucomicrobiae bacterium]|nr:UbiA family prenyltransferase [Verrucomicrobiae bacterium]